MGFKVNHSEATQGNGIKPEGIYECILIKCEERTTRNGATGLNFSFVVRNDIENQKYKNSYIFYTIWKRKNPTEADMSVKGYGFGQIMALGKACNLQDGKEYESLEEFCNELINKPVAVTLKHRLWNDVMQESVSFLSVTKFANVNHKFKEKTSTTATGYVQKNETFANTQPIASDSFEEIDDDDLPF